MLIYVARHHRPMIVLFGWLGSTPHHLRHYSMLYESMGYDSVTVIPTLQTAIFPHTMKDRAVSFLDKIEKVSVVSFSRCLSKLR